MVEKSCYRSGYFSRRIYKFFLVFLFSCCSLSVSAQLTASFTSTDTAGCAPLIVRFTNASKGATTYSWDLGNTITSTATDVSGSYFSAGTYTVTLTARSGSSASVYSMVIRVYDKPIVNFYANDTTVCEGVPITFTSTSISNAWGGINYIWNFGDGGASTAVAPVHAYPSPGSFNVTLFATNSKGCSNSFTRNSYITVFTPPFVDFSSPVTTFCSAPGHASFINTSSGKKPLLYTWEFGDMSVSTLTSPTHSYSVPAQYDVKLIVEDGNGCYDSSTQLSYITVGDLKASFSSLSAGCLNTPMKFINTSTTHISSKWYFGDGTTSDADTGSCSYSALGTYVVKLVVYDGTCYDSFSKSVTISSPTGSFTVTPQCLPVSTQTFTGSVTAGSSILWDFGDLIMQPGSPATHTYHPPPAPFFDPAPTPVYAVKMIITSPAGCTDTVKYTDTVKNLFIHADVASGYTVDGCGPLTTGFAADPEYAIINPHPPCPLCLYLTLPYPYKITGYLWDFGDGSALSTAPAPTHTYTAVGVYLVKCHAITADGCAGADSFTVSVGSKQHPSFVATATHACAGAPITYTSTSTSTSLIDDYIWDFGDGTLGGGTPAEGGGIATHRSEFPGIHTVRLTVVYNGCKAVDSTVDTIIAPTAKIDDKYTCIPSNGVVYRNLSIGADTHLWQFGDGDTSTVDSVVHFYPDLKTYTVKLSTYSATTGCRDTSTIFLELKRSSPSLKIFYPNVCRDFIDTFSTSVSYTDSVYASKSSWYTNGVLFASHLVHGKPFLDTAFNPMQTRGPNDITLIITDNHNCLDTVSASMMVGKPIDSFSIAPLVTCPSSPVNFTDHSADVPGFSILTYKWQFGDGTSATTALPAASHLYSTAGTYTIKEITVDNFGCADTFTSAAHPLVHKPKADFIPGSTYNCKGTTINFDNTSTGGVSYLWMFGDGATSTVMHPSHVYTTVGNYSVRLVAFDTYGCTDTFTQKDHITINPLPKASFYMDDSFAVCAPLNVNFINTSVGAPFANWSFGDGTYSTTLYPSDIYTSPGVYKVTLKVSNSYGCIDTAVGHATVFGYAGAFSYTPSSACATVPVHFSGVISGVTSVVWDFNDGFISLPSLKDTISHTYLAPGSYIPKLILTDLSGCSSFSLGVDTIKVDTVIADFSAVPDPVCQNSPVSFHDLSFGKYSVPSAWLWSFGSGATSTAAAPAYACSVSGVMPVTLLVTDGFGCTGTVTHSVFINPVPSPIVGPINICSGLPSVLSDTTAIGIWTSSNTSIAIVGSGTGFVTSLSKGTSTIAYTLTTGCKVAVTVTVEPLPAAITGVKTICAGAGITLTDATAGGTWSSGNTAVAIIGSASGNVIGVASGTTTVTYRVSTGCIATAIVKVDSSPVVITGRSVLCVGDTTALSDAITGGTWSCSNTLVAVVGPGSGLVAAKAQGIVTITYGLSSGCNTSKTITVNPLPAPLTGKASVCMGFSTTLSDAVVGGTWGSSNGAVAIVSSGVVSSKSAGTATITYALSTGCFTAEAVTVNPLPSPIIGASDVCVKQATTFSDLAVGGTWSSTDIQVAVGSLSGIVTGIAPGSATITYTLGTGCTTVKTVMVDIVPSAITGNKNICIGLTSVLSDATPGGIWYTADPSVSIGAGTGIAKGLTVGVAMISYTLSTGCRTATTVTVEPLPSAITGVKRVCVGATTILNDSVSGGTWTSSAPAIASVDASGAVTGLGQGTATITYTSGIGCLAQTTVSVIPVVAPIVGQATLCVGVGDTLSDATPGGIWTSSNNAVAGVTPLGAVNALSTGTATISYFASNVCDTATLHVVVNPLPYAGIVTGKDTFCSGVSEALIDSVKGGVWISDNSNIATVDASGVVTGLSGGVVGISYSFTNSCGTARAGLSLLVKRSPPPVHITTHPDSSLCANTLFQNFGADTPEPPGVHYTWSADNAVIYATAYNRQYCLISFGFPGPAIVRLSTGQSATECRSIDSLIYAVSTGESPVPVVVYYAPELVCKDNTADSYQWGYDDVHTLDSSLLAGMINQNCYMPHPDFVNNNYWVLTYHNGCLQKSYYNAPEAVKPAGSNSDALIKVFPNPAGSEINMEIYGAYRTGTTDVQLFDILGKERKVSAVLDGSGRMTLADLPPGVYMLLFSRDGLKIGSRTFVKD